MVEEFWRKAASQGGGGFFTGDNGMWHRTVGNIAVSCHAVIEDWVIPFAALHRSRGSRCFLKGHTTPQKLPIPLGVSTPSNTWFFEPTRVSSPNSISIVLTILQGTSVWPTHRQTDHVTCDICRNRPCSFLLLMQNVYFYTTLPLSGPLRSTLRRMFLSVCLVSVPCGVRTITPPPDI